MLPTKLLLRVKQPASVVKELLENAVDAKDIKLVIKDAGKALFRLLTMVWE
jgi:DNA mismatch repair protein MutL